MSCARFLDYLLWPGDLPVTANDQLQGLGHDRHLARSLHSSVAVNMECTAFPMRVNAQLKDDNYLELLSPSQLKMLVAIQADPDAGWKSAINEDIIRAWNRLTREIDAREQLKNRKKEVGDQ